jgi:hypothetical protein
MSQYVCICIYIYSKIMLKVCKQIIFQNILNFIYTVKLGYSNIGFCDTSSIASNIINIVVLIIKRYSFITTLFLGPFDDVITKFYCISDLSPCMLHVQNI